VVCVRLAQRDALRPGPRISASASYRRRRFLRRSGRHSTIEAGAIGTEATTSKTSSRSSPIPSVERRLGELAASV
jgi:hypothetical protein